MANDETNESPASATPEDGKASSTQESHVVEVDVTGGEQVAGSPDDQAESGQRSEPPAEDPLAAARRETSELKEKLLRTAADFDNFRKRSRREVSEAEKKGRDGLLKDLLPVFDNLERAATHALETQEANEASFKGLADGIDLVMRQFKDTLSRLGIERVESVGKPFDPSVHEAIQHLETPDYEPGSIAAEVQAGYREGERLVRAALVVVAKAPSAASGEGESAPKDSDVN